MSDYIDAIANTISSLTRKARQAGEQVIESVDRNGAVRDVYARGTERAKAFGRIAKLTRQLGSENNELERIYREIGMLYFEQARTAPEGFFAPLFAEAESAAARIDALRSEIRDLREQYLDEGAEEDIEVEIGEFEDVVAADESAAKGE